MGKVAKLTEKVTQQRERIEFLTYELRKANIRIRNYEKTPIDKLRRELSDAKLMVKRRDASLEKLKADRKRVAHNNKWYLYNLRQQRKKNKSVAARAREKEERIEKEVEYLVRDVGKGKQFNDTQVRELILRTLVTYEGLIKERVISFDEIMYLLVGSQIQAFDLDDVKARTTHLSGLYRKNFAEFIEAGLFARMYRKEKYYLTGIGRQRLNDILNYIYQNKIGTYKLLSRVFRVEEKE